MRAMHLVVEVFNIEEFIHSSAIKLPGHLVFTMHLGSDKIRKCVKEK